MNYMINLKSLGLLLAWFPLSPLAQSSPRIGIRRIRSNSNSAAEHVNEVPAQAVTGRPFDGESIAGSPAGSGARMPELSSGWEPEEVGV